MKCQSQRIEIGRKYEYSLEQYFQNEGIYPCKSKCGAFKLPSTRVLNNTKAIIENCEYIATNRKQSNKKLVKDLPEAIKNCEKCAQSCSKKITVYDGKKENLMKFSQQYNTNKYSDDYFHGMNMNVWLRDSRRASPYAEFPANHVLSDSSNRGKQIFEIIMARNYGENENVAIKSDIPNLYTALEDFQKHHKRFHYSGVLTHMLKINKESQPPGQLEVPMKELFSYLTFVILKVVPVTLFGKCKNRQKIIKAACRLLKTARYEPLNLKKLMATLDVSSIQWLKGIHEEDLKWYIFSKFLKWFFIDFIIRTIRCLFYVTSNPESQCQKFFIRCGDWYKVKKKFKKAKVNAGVFQTPLDIDDNFPPPGRLILFPKHVGVRPVIKTMYTWEDQSDITIVLKFLRQLYVTQFGMATNINTFHAEWKSLKKNHAKENLKFVTSDLTDAFGSIRQEKLYDILWTLTDDLPEDLVYPKYVIFNPKSIRRNDYSLAYRSFFADDVLEPSMRPGTLYARDDSKKTTVKVIKKSWLLERIEKFISYQMIEVGKKSYVIRKGVAQGILLSPILSDIYYSFVLKKHFHTFIKTGFLFRYMDDILYITKQDDAAVRFIALTKKGVSKYNCRFKASKTQTNVHCDDCVAVNAINFLGYKLNCQTLEVVPVYPNVKPHYTALSFKRNNEGPLAILKRRLYNIGTLRLTHIVLDKSINSFDTLIAILKKALYIHVSRAKALILSLFDDIASQAQQIFAIIKGSNKKIFKTVRRIYFKRKKDTENTEKNRKYIMQLICDAYKESFSKHPILNKIFVKNVFDR